MENSDFLGVQEQLYGIGIFEEEIVLTDYTGREEKRFVVTPEQLAGFFRTDGVMFRPFPGLIWMKDNGDGRTYLVTLPAAERAILYKRNKKVDPVKLRFPSLAVKASVSGEGKVTGVDVWAFAGSTLTPASILYELPLPNIGGSGMCLGGNRPVGHDVMDGIAAALFDGVFNNHRDVCGREKMSFHDYRRKYRGTMPLRTLNRIGTGRQILEGGR